MFTIAEMSDVVKIPPNRQGTSLKETSISILKEKYESMISSDLGYVIMIIDADINAIGKLVSGDGATYHRVNFKALTFYPTLQEIVEGELIEITDSLTIFLVLRAEEYSTQSQQILLVKPHFQYLFL